MAQKQSVVVDGVTLSRETLEKAIQELNTPEQEPSYLDFPAGTIVQFGGIKGVVVDNILRNILRKHYRFGDDSVWIVSLELGRVYNLTPTISKIEKVVR